MNIHLRERTQWGITTISRVRETESTKSWDGKVEELRRRYKLAWNNERWWDGGWWTNNEHGRQATSNGQECVSVSSAASNLTCWEANSIKVGYFLSPRSALMKQQIETKGTTWRSRSDNLSLVCSKVLLGCVCWIKATGEYSSSLLRWTAALLLLSHSPSFYPLSSTRFIGD